MDDNGQSSALKTFIKDLKEFVNDAVLFLPGKFDITSVACISGWYINGLMYVVCTHFLSGNIVECINETASDENDDLAYSHKVDVLSRALSAKSVQELITSITMTKEERDCLEKNTREQSDSTLWKMARAGRITASNFHRVFTKVTNLNKNPALDMGPLVNSFLQPSNLNHISHIARGKLLEPAAVKCALDILRDTHVNLKSRSSGLYIHPVYHYIGASPDQILTCDCHGVHLLEVKCPTIPIDSLPYLSNGKLKTNCAYYSQVQGQMEVTGIKSAIFFVYKTDTENFLETVLYDSNYCSKLVKHLVVFYTQYLAPKLLMEPQSKRHKHS